MSDKSLNPTIIAKSDSILAEPGESSKEKQSPYTAASLSLPGVSDQATNNRWKNMTRTGSFSDPGVAQMLNDGLTLVEKPVLIADNKKLPGAEIHDWLRSAVHDTKHYLDNVKTSDSVHEISTVAQGITDGFRAVLHDQNRDRGEFQWVIAERDHKLYCSSKRFTLPIGRVFGYELHLSSPLKMQPEQTTLAVLHTHPNEPGMDPNRFSLPDKWQADSLQRGDSTVTIRSYLLTPDNRVLAYTPKESKEHPDGEEVGFFLKNGMFIVTNDKFNEFKDKKAIESAT